MSILDIAALAIFVSAWIGYGPLRIHLAKRRGGGINADMHPVREAWMRQFLARDNRIMDVNLLGHLLNSASFFASTNLLVIAAAAGVLFGGEPVRANLQELELSAPASDWLIELKVGVVVVTLSRGLLDFVWAIRQLNYALALLGAAPAAEARDKHDAFLRASADVLHPSFSAFNTGVRAYYFALAAAAWLVSPWAMIAGVVATIFVLLRRQMHSQAARGIRAAREICKEP
jgi:uncharacterized membrane protein